MVSRVGTEGQKKRYKSMDSIWVKERDPVNGSVLFRESQGKGGKGMEYFQCRTWAQNTERGIIIYM